MKRLIGRSDDSKLIFAKYFVALIWSKKIAEKISHFSHILDFNQDELLSFNDGEILRTDVKLKSQNSFSEGSFLKGFSTKFENDQVS